MAEREPHTARLSAAALPPPPLLKLSWPPLNRWRLICYDGFRRHMWLTRASRVVPRVNEIIKLRLPADQHARLPPACQAPAYSSSPAKMAHVSRECYNCLPPGVHYITPLCNFLLPNNSHDVGLIVTAAMQNIAYCYANVHDYLDILHITVANYIIASICTFMSTCVIQ